mmetsp:Transcript_24404/g.67838  ORF Transcript_24404/g.67838 Transcript_24404/m.67838 type:complete len:103 (-) Transcript_24404:233-541(-)
MQTCPRSDCSALGSSSLPSSRSPDYGAELDPDWENPVMRPHLTPETESSFHSHLCSIPPSTSAYGANIALARLGPQGSRLSTNFMAGGVCPVSRGISLKTID